MPYKLKTLVKKIELIPNLNNRQIAIEFLQYMTDRDCSVNHQINNLKVILSFAGYLGLNKTFKDVNKKEQILEFLDTKKKDLDDDGERKWITTWNYYLNRIKLFYRWLYNRNKDQTIEIEQEDLETPEFVRIRTKKTKRLSPYSESELWDRDDILLITKYEKHRRNKAVLTLLWDLDARPHEITLLKIKHISIREQYGEGEIPHQAKTGSGISLGMNLLIFFIGSSVGPVIAGIYLQANQVLVESDTDGILASFPSPDSYNLIFLTATLISMSSIGFAILLNRSMSNRSGDVNEIGVPT